MHFRALFSTEAICFFALFLISPFWITLAYAENKTTTIPISGVSTPSEVIQLFGKPEHQDATKNSSIEKWTYGKSYIYFQDGKVSAWQNAGELSEKAVTQQYKKPNPTSYRESGWENPWTPEKKAKTEDVLHSLE